MHQLLSVVSTGRPSDSVSYSYDKAGNPVRRTEMGLGVTNSFNNLNQIVSGIWTGGAITVAGAVKYAAGTVTVNSTTGKLFPDKTFEVTNVTVSAGTNILTAVYYGPAFTNSQMVATDMVTVVVGNSAYTHDANGNLTSDETFTYQYDLANRLTNVILNASNVSVLAVNYDGLGRRIQVSRNGTTTERYVYLPGSFLTLAILDGSNAVKEFYTHGPDLSGSVGGAGGIGGILSCRIGTTNRWLHAGAMGNILLATDQQGKEVGQYRYSPFGRLLNRTGDFTPRFLYSSKEFDPESGLINYGRRHMNPRIGRWMERDRIEEAGGVNLYLSLGNNPANMVDGHGEIPLDTIWDIGNIIYDIAIGDYVSLAADTAALLVPYVPAGSTKLVKVAKATDVIAICPNAKKLTVAYEYLPVAQQSFKHTLPKGARNWVKGTVGRPSKFTPGWGDAEIKPVIERALKQAKAQGKLKPTDIDGFIYDAGTVVSGGPGNGASGIVMVEAGFSL